jgi:hypothetical protein
MSHRGRAQLSGSKSDKWICNVKNKSQYYTADTVNYTGGVQEPMGSIQPPVVKVKSTHTTRVCVTYVPRAVNEDPKSRPVT